MVPQSVREDHEHEEAGKDENPAGRVDRVAEASSLQHLMTHLLKNPHRSPCQRANVQNKPHKNKQGVNLRLIT